MEGEAPVGRGEGAGHLSALLVEQHHEPFANRPSGRLVDDLPDHRLRRKDWEGGGQRKEQEERSGAYNPTDTPNRASDCWIGTSTPTPPPPPFPSSPTNPHTPITQTPTTLRPPTLR